MRNPRRCCRRHWLDVLLNACVCVSVSVEGGDSGAADGLETQVRLRASVATTQQCTGELLSFIEPALTTELVLTCRFCSCYSNSPPLKVCIFRKNLFGSNIFSFLVISEKIGLDNLSNSALPSVQVCLSWHKITLKIVPVILGIMQSRKQSENMLSRLYPWRNNPS